jgi:hypothetical protein
MIAALDDLKASGFNHLIKRGDRYGLHKRRFTKLLRQRNQHQNQFQLPIGILQARRLGNEQSTGPQSRARRNQRSGVKFPPLRKSLVSPCSSALVAL